MDDKELFNTLNEQKIPLDVAVEQKLAYLQSDNVFSPDDDYYLTHFATYTNTQSRDNSDDDELLSAFGAQSEKQPTNSLSNMRIQPQRIEVPRSAAQPQAQNQQQNAPMSLADRIAALRGAISVPNEYKRK